MPTTVPFALGETTAFLQSIDLSSLMLLAALCGLLLMLQMSRTMSRLARALSEQVHLTQQTFNYYHGPIFRSRLIKARRKSHRYELENLGGLAMNLSAELIGRGNVHISPFHALGNGEKAEVVVRDFDNPASVRIKIRYTDCSKRAYTETWALTKDGFIAVASSPQVDKAVPKQSNKQNITLLNQGSSKSTEGSIAQQ